MLFRILEDSELAQAVEIQGYCWGSDYSELAPPNGFDKAKSLEFMRAWRNEHCEDIRVILGAFDGLVLAGFAGASIADTDDSANGMEVNYLFVDKQYRNLGLGLKLLKTVVDMFHDRGFDEVVIYNWHDVPSNQFYRHLGGVVKKQVTQTPGGHEVLVDVFFWKIEELKSTLDAKINYRY